MHTASLIDVRTISRTDETDVIARLRERLGDVRWYDLATHYVGIRVDPAQAWAIFDQSHGTRLIQVDDAMGTYKIVVDDHSWFTLRPAIEFIPDQVS